MTRISGLGKQAILFSLGSLEIGLESKLATSAQLQVIYCYDIGS